MKKETSWRSIKSGVVICILIGTLSISTERAAAALSMVSVPTNPSPPNFNYTLEWTNHKIQDQAILTLEGMDGVTAAGVSGAASSHWSVYEAGTTFPTKVTWIHTGTHSSTSTGSISSFWLSAPVGTPVALRGWSYDSAYESKSVGNVMTPIPEPATVCLLGFGGLALLRRSRRRLHS